MATTKKYVSLDKLSLYNEKIKKVITDGDAAALAEAKAFASGLASNYEAAGTVNTAKEALQNNIDAVEVKADAAAEAAAKAQGEVDALETLVGALPEGTSATTVVGYVDAKTAGIATDAALGELNTQVAGLQTAVQGIQADYLTSADKTALNDAITAEANRAKGVEGGLETRLAAVEGDYLKGSDKTALQESIDGVAEDVAEIAGDYLKAADKTELQGKIDAKASQTDLDAEVTRATNAEANLQTQINTIMNNPDAEGAINSINEFTQYVTEHGTIAEGMRTDINKNKDDIAAMDTAYKAADSALAGRLDVLEAIDHDAYAAADTALKNELTTEIGKKADASVVSDMDAAYKAADTALDERLQDVEAALGTGDGSVADQIADAKQEAIDAAVEAAATDATTKANAAETNAKNHANSLNSAMDTRVASLETASATHALASDVTALTGRVTTVEGKVSTLETEMDAVEALAAANKTATETNAANIAKKADATALTAATDRITAVETWQTNFIEVSEEEINALFA